MSQVTFDILARDKASAVLSKVGKSVDDSGKRLKKFGKHTTDVGKKMTLGLTTPIVALGIKSLQVFADFDQSMRQVGVQTGQSGKGLKSLSDFALKMGQDTKYSAGEAADAMLELAKGGMSAADIKGGALQSTLTLAAAGGLDLADAATATSNALHMFGLKAADANKVAAALAGGANASSASVSDLTQALGQVGPQAKLSGLDMNDTVAVLAEFHDAGMKGSDAGTSLKTMLQRLVPQTDAAKDAMKDLGLKFTDAHGHFKSIGDIADQLKDKFKGLTDKQKAQKLQTIFGSDATRAASILLDGGKKKLDKYRTATEDLSAAQKLAKTNTDGTKGAIEKMNGSVETAEIALGKAMAPTVQKVADKIGKLADKFSSLSPKTQGTILAIAGVTAVLGPLIIGLGMLATAISALAANPIMLVVIAVAALVVGLVVLYKKSETFRTIVNKSFYMVEVAALSLVEGFLGLASWTLKAFKMMTDIALTWASNFLQAAAIAFSWLPDVDDKMTAAVAAMDKFKKGADKSFDGAISKVDQWNGTVKGMKKEAVLKANITDLDHKIARARKELKDPNLTKERRARLHADISQLLRRKRDAQSSINALHGKTVSIHLDTGQFYSGISQARATGFHGRFASGGQVDLSKPGGAIRKMAAGGGITGPGGGTDDKAGLFALSNGEFVMNRRAVDRYGAGLLHAMNGAGTSSGRAGAMHPAAGGVQTVRVVVDVKGGDAEMRKLIRKWIRTDNLLGSRA